MPAAFGQPTIATIIKQLDKTPPADKLDLTNNASVQMKPAESMASLVEALRDNNSVKTLVLRQCELNDAAAAEIGTLITQNQVIEELDLEHNNISSSGAIAIADGLIKNHSIRQLNMLHQHGGCFGEVTLERYMEMLGTNVTVTKILWRLESRKSFALTKMISRNVEIWRRIASGRADYVDMLPDHLRASPPLVLTEKCAPKQVVIDEEGVPPTTDGGSPEQNDTKAEQASEVPATEPEVSNKEPATEATASQDAAAADEIVPSTEKPTEELPAETGEKGEEEPPKDPVEIPQQ
mmetsp:Transcript_51224/g.101765  ORF Transcript_51224/g.101765 Transcript_51224/m.101765 type:complete len:294 (-) Transcript_51224:178-1059(-)